MHSTATLFWQLSGKFLAIRQLLQVFLSADSSRFCLYAILGSLKAFSIP